MLSYFKLKSMVKKGRQEELVNNQVSNIKKQHFHILLERTNNANYINKIIDKIVSLEEDSRYMSDKFITTFFDEYERVIDVLKISEKIIENKVKISDKALRLIIKKNNVSAHFVSHDLFILIIKQYPEMEFETISTILDYYLNFNKDKANEIIKCVIDNIKNKDQALIKKLLEVAGDKNKYDILKYISENTNEVNIEANNLALNYHEEDQKRFFKTELNLCNRDKEEIKKVAFCAIQNFKDINNDYIKEILLSADENDLHEIINNIIAEISIITNEKNMEANLNGIFKSEVSDNIISYLYNRGFGYYKFNFINTVLESNYQNGEPSDKFIADMIDAVLKEEANNDELKEAKFSVIKKIMVKVKNLSCDNLNKLINYYNKEKGSENKIKELLKIAIDYERDYEKETVAKDKKRKGRKRKKEETDKKNKMDMSNRLVSLAVMEKKVDLDLMRYILNHGELLSLKSVKAILSNSKEIYETFRDANNPDAVVYNLDVLFLMSKKINDLPADSVEIIFSNIIKSVSYIKECYNRGLRYFKNNPSAKLLPENREIYNKLLSNFPNVVNTYAYCLCQQILETNGSRYNKKLSRYALEYVLKFIEYVDIDLICKVLEASKDIISKEKLAELPALRNYNHKFVECVLELGGYGSGLINYIIDNNINISEKIMAKVIVKMLSEGLKDNDFNYNKKEFKNHKEKLKYNKKLLKYVLEYTLKFAEYANIKFMCKVLEANREIVSKEKLAELLTLRKYDPKLVECVLELNGYEPELINYVIENNVDISEKVMTKIVNKVVSGGMNINQKMASQILAKYPSLENSLGVYGSTANTYETIANPQKGKTNAGRYYEAKTNIEQLFEGVIKTTWEQYLLRTLLDAAKNFSMKKYVDNRKIMEAIYAITDESKLSIYNALTTDIIRELNDLSGNQGFGNMIWVALQKEVPFEEQRKAKKVIKSLNSNKLKLKNCALELINERARIQKMKEIAQKKKEQKDRKKERELLRKNERLTGADTLVINNVPVPAPRKQIGFVEPKSRQEMRCEQTLQQRKVAKDIAGLKLAQKEGGRFTRVANCYLGRQ